MAIFPLSVLRVSGADAANLLQRMTTNEVIKRAPGEVFSNVFTSDKGRVLDWTTMIKGADHVLVLGQAPGPALQRWIKKMIFREKVKVEDLSPTHEVRSFFAGEQAPSAQLLAQVRAKVAGFQGVHRVSEKAAPHERPLLDPAALEHLRVGSGVPWLGKDLSDENNPHEAQLGEAISWDKGCYLGQEVVARLDTYGKVQKYLRRLRLSAPVAVGTTLSRAGEAVGAVTSVSALDGEVIALGYVHKKAEDAATLQAGEVTATLLVNAV